METTFKMLGAYMEKNKTNELILGRKSPYSIPDATTEGMNILQTTPQRMREQEDPESEWQDLEEEEETLEQEVEDDGGLDLQ